MPKDNEFEDINIPETNGDKLRRFAKKTANAAGKSSELVERLQEKTLSLVKEKSKFKKGIAIPLTLVEDVTLRLPADMLHFASWLATKFLADNFVIRKLEKTYVKTHRFPTFTAYLDYYVVFLASLMYLNVGHVRSKESPDKAVAALEWTWDKVRGIFVNEESASENTAGPAVEFWKLFANGTQGMQTSSRQHGSTGYPHDIHTSTDIPIGPDEPVYALIDAKLVNIFSVHSDQPNTSAEYITADGYTIPYRYFKPGTDFPKTVKKGDLLGRSMTRAQWLKHHTADTQQHIDISLLKGGRSSSNYYNPVPLLSAYDAKYAAVPQYVQDLAGRLMAYRFKLLKSGVKGGDQRWKNLEAAGRNMRDRNYDQVKSFCDEFGLNDGWSSDYPKLSGVTSFAQAAKSNVKLKAGFITPNVSKEVFEAQMERLEPVLAIIAVAKEGVWERGYQDPDLKRVTGSVGIQNYTERGPILDKQIVPGFDGKFGLTETEKKYAYEDVMYKYRNEFYPQIRRYIRRPLTDAQMIVVADMFFQMGNWAMDKGEESGLLKLINNPKSTDDQIAAKLSEYRYVVERDKKGRIKKTTFIGGSVLRGGLRAALWRGDIMPREFLNMQSSALYNVSAGLGNYVFWAGSRDQVKSKPVGTPLQYRFDKQVWDTVIKPYRYSDPRGAFVNGQGNDMDKGGNIGPNRDLMPAWVAAEIEKTATGLPVVDDNKLAWLQSLIDGNQMDQPIERAVADVSNENLRASAKYADKALGEMDKYIARGETENWWDKLFGTTRDDPGKLARRALALDPDNMMAKMVLVWEARAYGNDSTAIALAQEIVGDPNLSISGDSIANVIMARTQLYAGQSYENMGYPYKAYTNYSWAQGREPDLNLANKIHKMDSLAKLTPAPLAEAERLRRENQTDAALGKALDFVYGGNLDNYAPQHRVTAHVMIAEIRSGKGEYKLAAENYKKAFDASDDPKYMYLAAESAMSAREYDMAAKYAAFVCFGNYYMDSPTEKARFWAIAGRAREALKQYSRAWINYSNANSLDKTYYADVQRIAAALIAQDLAALEASVNKKNYKTAVDQANDLLDQQLDAKQKAKALYLKGLAKESLGDLKNALECYKLAVASDHNQDKYKKSYDALNAKLHPAPAKKFEKGTEKVKKTQSGKSQPMHNPQKVPPKKMPQKNKGR